MMKSVTIYDIAKEANVSVATVSRVLNDTAPVKASTRETIMKIIEKYKFQPNALARSLTTKETSTIAMIISDISNPFFVELFCGSENKAREMGYIIYLCNSAGEYARESKYLSILHEKRVDGIIIVGGRIDRSNCPPELIQEVVDIAKGIPIVLVNGNLSKSNLHRVYTDEETGAALATQHLIELGHKEIAFIGGFNNMTTTNRKVKGVKKKLEEHQLQLRKDWLLQGDYSITAGKELMNNLLDQAERPTAVICFNDLTAIGAIRATTERGLLIPNDISIVGFDDSPMSTAVVPELTTVALNTYELGQQAVQRIYQLKYEKVAKRNIVLQPKLIVRQSTATVSNKTIVYSNVFEKKHR